jgi:hypothetical protein
MEVNDPKQEVEPKHELPKRDPNPEGRMLKMTIEVEKRITNETLKAAWKYAVSRPMAGLTDWLYRIKETRTKKQLILNLTLVATAFAAAILTIRGSERNAAIVTLIGWGA